MADPKVEALLTDMSDDDVVKELMARVSQRKLYDYEPYPYQKEFHHAGKHYPERMLRAGNRVGKTMGACSEDAYHATGEYPSWWEGKRFNQSVKVWVVSITNETSRDILQEELLGTPIGTGLIPLDKIMNLTYRQCGIGNVVDTIFVNHKSGGTSMMTFKCYEQGWRKFSGTAMEVIHLDEEPEDFRIYTECRTRIITKNGIMYTSLTPLMGETALIERFNDYKEGVFMITASMLECPHLKGKVEAIMADYPEHEREARLNGTPIIGEGRVFSYPDNAVLTPPIMIPNHWARICGIDFGINEQHQQASGWLAHDRDTDIVYLYDEYKEPDKSIAQHAEAIKSRSRWIPVAWPHDGVNRGKDGNILKDEYLIRDVPMLSKSARYENEIGGKQSVEPIIAMLCERIDAGRFKVFPQCRKFMNEFRSLHRKNGVIQAKKDDLIKGVLYGLMMLRFAAVDLLPQSAHQQPAMRAWANS